MGVLCLCKNAGEEVELVLPFDKYDSGEPLEPQGYFRWYDFKKDRACANLKKIVLQNLF